MAQPVDHLEAQIIAVLYAARFAVRRGNIETAEILFARAQALMRQLPRDP